MERQRFNFAIAQGTGEFSARWRHINVTIDIADIRADKRRANVMPSEKN
jgi:hypothetical protein